MPFDRTRVGLGSLLLALSLVDPRAAEAAGTDATPATTATPETMDGATYAVRLRDLQERLDNCKEKIRRHHTRVTLLGGSILGGGAGPERRPRSGSRASCPAPSGGAASSWC